MTLIEAINSGREFKRAKWLNFVNHRDRTEDLFNIDDIVAEDWELKPFPETVECWVNFYQHHHPQVYKTKELADKGYRDCQASFIRIGEAVQVMQRTGWNHV